MIRSLLALLLALAAPILLAQEPAAKANPKVAFKTNQGEFVIELYPDKAPKTVENFLAYVNEGHYNGTIFHRVINGFMIQGGGYTSDLQARPTKPPIKNEASNGLKNSVGTVAMARTGDPHSATSQFFVNVADNGMLDFKSEASGQTFGYAVFGKVVEGMDVVNKIKAIPTEARSALFQNLPAIPVLVEKAEVVQ